jgi:hypothetical protein
MNAQQALEAAYNQINNDETFTYGLQYYGTNLGYLVFMINESYDTFLSSSSPFFYWEFLGNGSPAATGIDNTKLSPGNQVQFSFEQYIPERHQQSLLRVKHEFQMRATTRK